MVRAALLSAMLCLFLVANRGIGEAGDEGERSSLAPGTCRLCLTKLIHVETL